MFQKTSEENYKKVENKTMERLVKKAVKGNNAAFEELIRMTSKLMLYTSGRVLRDFRDAEDATQEAIFRIYKNIGSLKDPSSFIPWMKRIVMNQCYEHIRKNEKNEKNVIMGMDDMIEDARELDKEFLPAEYAENKEQRMRIRKIISTLSDEREQIVTMYYYDDLTYKEIAYVLGKTTGHISSSLSRAKEIIKGELEKDPHFNAKTIKKGAALPVLSIVLAEQIDEVVSKQAIDNIMAYTHNEVIAGTVFKSSTAGHVIKAIGILIVSTVLVTGGVVYAISNMFGNPFDYGTHDEGTVGGIQVTEPKAQLTDGVIEIKGDTVGEYYVNPRSIKLTGIDNDYIDVFWKIVNNKTKEEYKGEGTIITKDVTELYDNKLNGKYTAYYTARYDYGDLDVKIDFVIDSSLK